MDPNAPTYVISGKERRTLKKEWNSIKSALKSFWYYHQIDKGMAQAYDISLRDDGHFPMSDELAEERYKELQSKALNIEKLLLEKLK
jgi:hypothetical protein